MSENVPFIGDFYETLGVAKEATADEIKKAFRKLARECHPDVAGNDPEAARRFDRVRKAYETLSDPEARERYDRRSAPRRRRSWTDNRYRMPGGLYVHRDGGPGGGDAEQPRRRGGRTHSSNNLDLNDIFGDFGFGEKPPRAARPPAGEPAGPLPGFQAPPEGRDFMDFGDGDGGGPPPDNRQTYGARGADGARTGSPGADIQLQVDVPAAVAARGGVVTLEYPRLRLSEDGRAVARFDELHDLRVPPGVRTGTALRVPRMGDAGTDGSVGDLVCELRVAAEAPGPSSGGRSWFDGPPPAARPPEAPRGRAPAPPPRPPSATPAEAELTVPISVVEALLGGRVPVDSPSGSLRLTLPPGTSSGTRVRLRGKGPNGVDLYVVFQIVVPRVLDDESRQLIERFAELNPDDPREL
jgi:DnaJ-class molecular chaperone